MSTRWLNSDEIRFLEPRQQARRAIKPIDHKDHHFSKSALFSVLTDWKVYLLIFVNWSNSVPNYAMKFTMPQIIKNMGYTSANAQLLTMPPYAVGAVSAYCFSILADRYWGACPLLLCHSFASL